MSNEYILSVSFDKTICVWNTSDGECVRKIQSPIVMKQQMEKIKKIKKKNINFSNIIPTCCSFHPLNNNIFLIGFSNQIVQFFNLSTGKPFAKPIEISDFTTTLTFSHSGDLFFISDKNGFIYMYSCDFSVANKTNIKLLKKTRISNSPITSISFSLCWNVDSKKGNPSLLINTCDNCIRLCSIDSIKKTITETGVYPIYQKKKCVRSQFCPLVSQTKGAYFVSGSEIGHVFVFDLTQKDKKSFVNKLMAHNEACLDVSWNYEETLLASCSEDGLVVIWKR